MNQEKKSFGSDNHSGIHPDVLNAIASANSGDCHGYGNDGHTEEAVGRFKTLLGENIAVFFVFNGTGANVLGIKSMTRPYNAVIAASSAHLQVDECGAPENFTGCKIKLIDTPDGKLTVENIEEMMFGFGDQHHVQAKVVSIAQATEPGTVYQPYEIRAIADVVHQHGLILHMDGSRIANAAAGLGCSLKEITAQCGVDVLSFGGTKNGMMMGEAVVFFDGGGAAAREFKYIRKQGMQLFSKMRFLAAQFNAYLCNGLWLKNARRANAMAALLKEKIKKFPQLEIAYPVQSNAVFVKIPKKYIQPLLQHYFFYEWNEIDQDTSIVRWMTSFNTTEEDIAGFVRTLERVL
ncbi:MAG: low specificity L-threonine aldolase [bacterium]|nr:low specificity L-threonine aldolase [bacterium]